MSRKNKREDRLVRGDEILEGRGVDLDADDDVLLPALLAARGSHPDADLSIADLLGSIPSEEAARALVEWDRSNPADKDLRRVLRSSLFRLHQRGIAAAAREKAAGEPVRIADPVTPTGYLSPVDGAGNRLAWLTRPRPGGGLTVLYSLINDRTGMRQIDALHVNRNQFRQILADATRDGVPMTQAPHAYVDWLMHEAYRRGAPRDEKAGGYPLLRAEITSESPAPVASPVDEMIETPSPEQETTLLAESSRLFDEPEFGGWVPPDDLVKPYQTRFHDAQDSGIVINKQQMTDRLTGIIDQALTEVLGGPARELYAARLKEMALWYMLAPASRDARPLALICYALHRAMAEPDRRLDTIPFFKALIFRAFVHLMPRASKDEPERSEKEADDPSRLIVRPD